MSKLTNEQAEAYIKTLATGERKLDGMEANVLAKLRLCEQKMNAHQQQAQQAQKAFDQARAEMAACQGEARGYVDLLIEAESARRDAQAPAPDASDEEKPAASVSKLNKPAKGNGKTAQV